MSKACVLSPWISWLSHGRCFASSAAGACSGRCRISWISSSVSTRNPKARALALIQGDRTDSFDDVITAALATHNEGSREAVILLLEHEWDDPYFSDHYASTAAFVLLAWGSLSAKRLAEAVRSAWDSARAISITRVLAFVGAGRFELPFVTLQSQSQEDIRARIREDRSTQEACWIALQELLGAERRDDAVRLAQELMVSLVKGDEAVFRAIVLALSLRWLRIGPQVVGEYEDLIEHSPNNEGAFQQFFEDHPQLLDPLAAEVRAQPEIEGTFPDFVIHRIDGTLLVVEIETPAKKLLIKNGNWSAPANHAIGQVEDYLAAFGRGNADPAEMDERRHADGLAVVGLERALSHKQQRRLVVRSRARGVRVVGFDWLAQRARQILENVMSDPLIQRNTRYI